MAVPREEAEEGRADFSRSHYSHFTRHEEHEGLATKNTEITRLFFVILVSFVADLRGPCG
jgi:hypothetical protein